MEINEKASAEFAADLIKGLNASEKYIPSKYFYNQIGDKLFQKIMELPEYYLTRAEWEIISNQKEEITKALDFDGPFDIVELGSGDGQKTKMLLNHLISIGKDFRYLPIDISKDVLLQLKKSFETEIGCEVLPINLTYLEGYRKALQISDRPRLFIFLGSNIGNFTKLQAKEFLEDLIVHANEKDEFLIGIDLKKDPAKILSAYNDKSGTTRDFNLNLLKRINTEFNANFDISKFLHYPIYDPGTGTARSYLVAKESHDVKVNDLTMNLYFKSGEAILTEVSQKYFPEEINSMIRNTGFKIKESFMDENRYFADILITAGGLS